MKYTNWATELQVRTLGQWCHYFGIQPKIEDSYRKQARDARHVYVESVNFGNAVTIVQLEIEINHHMVRNLVGNLLVKYDHSVTPKCIYASRIN